MVRKDGNTQKWLNEEYPQIKKEAKSENADIWWADETACQNLANNLKGYAPIGTHNKPVLEHTAKRCKRLKIQKILASVQNGKEDWMMQNLNILRKSRK